MAGEGELLGLAGEGRAVKGALSGEAGELDAPGRSGWPSGSKTWSVACGVEVMLRFCFLLIQGLRPGRTPLARIT